MTFLLETGKTQSHLLKCVFNPCVCCNGNILVQCQLYCIKLKIWTKLISCYACHPFSTKMPKQRPMKPHKYGKSP